MFVETSLYLTTKWKHWGEHVLKLSSYFCLKEKRRDKIRQNIQGVSGLIVAGVIISIVRNYWRIEKSKGES